jgi:hypothetical protein
MNAPASDRRIRPLRLIGYVLARPRLYLPALRTAWRFRRRGWYRRGPFLPLPPAEYLAWRFHTAYGDDAEPGPGELDRYLRWASRMDRNREADTP